MTAVVDASFSGFLRWILIGVGVMVVIAVYLISRREGISRREADRASGPDRVPPDFPRDAAETGRDGALPERSGGPVEEQGDESDRPRLAQADPLGNAVGAETGADDRVLVLHVQSRSPRHKFSGADILRVAEQAGLERAATVDNEGFFQRRAPGSASEADPGMLFYVTDMFDPGVFKWSEMESFSTSGVSLFARLPGVLSPLETFDELLECARLFADGLQGAVFDESHSDLTSQTIQHIKEDLQAYAAERAASGPAR